MALNSLGLLFLNKYQQSGRVCPLILHARHFKFFNFLKDISSVKFISALFQLQNNLFPFPFWTSVVRISSSNSPTQSALNAFLFTIIGMALERFWNAFYSSITALQYFNERTFSVSFACFIYRIKQVSLINHIAFAKSISQIPLIIYKNLCFSAIFIACSHQSNHCVIFVYLSPLSNSVYCNCIFLIIKFFKGLVSSFN